MGYVERYLNYLMTSVQAQLYGNGGPIIMVQVRHADCLSVAHILLAGQ